jgi:hypothetical protein
VDESSLVGYAIGRGRGTINVMEWSDWRNKIHVVFQDGKVVMKAGEFIIDGGYRRKSAQANGF